MLIKKIKLGIDRIITVQSKCVPQNNEFRESMIPNKSLLRLYEQFARNRQRDIICGTNKLNKMLKRFLHEMEMPD